MKEKCKCKIKGSVLEICKGCSYRKLEKFEEELSRDQYWVSKFAKWGVVLRGK